MVQKGIDEFIIHGICSGGDLAEQALCQLYDMMRTSILGFVQKNKGTRDDGLDLLQDAIVIVYEQIRNGKYEHHSKLSTYIYSVARHIWLNRLKRKKIQARILDNQAFEEVQESPLAGILSAEYEKNIQDVMQLLGADCRQLLTLVLYENRSMQEVHERMHYENEQVIRNKKYKCLKVLKEILAAKPHLVILLKSGYHG